MSDDPRLNAPPCISHLSLDDRLAAMAARDDQRRENYMARYRSPPQPRLLQRLLAWVGL